MPIPWRGRGIADDHVLDDRPRRAPVGPDLPDPHLLLGNRADDALLAFVPRHGHLGAVRERELALGPLDADAAGPGIERDLHAGGNGNGFLADAGHGDEEETKGLRD